MKRIIALIITILLIVQMFPANVFANGGNLGGTEEGIGSGGMSTTNEKWASTANIQVSMYLLVSDNATHLSKSTSDVKDFVYLSRDLSIVNQNREAAIAEYSSKVDPHNLASQFYLSDCFQECGSSYMYSTDNKESNAFIVRTVAPKTHLSQGGNVVTEDKITGIDINKVEFTTVSNGILTIGNTIGNASNYSNLLTSYNMGVNGNGNPMIGSVQKTREFIQTSIEQCILNGMRYNGITSEGLASVGINAGSSKLYVHRIKTSNKLFTDLNNIVEIEICDKNGKVLARPSISEEKLYNAFLYNMKKPDGNRYRIRDVITKKDAPIEENYGLESMIFFKIDAVTGNYSATIPDDTFAKMKYGKYYNQLAANPYLYCSESLRTLWLGSTRAEVGMASNSGFDVEASMNAWKLYNQTLYKMRNSKEYCNSIISLNKKYNSGLQMLVGDPTGWDFDSTGHNMMQNHALQNSGDSTETTYADFRTTSLYQGSDNIKFNSRYIYNYAEVDRQGSQSRKISRYDEARFYRYRISNAQPNVAGGTSFELRFMPEQAKSSAVINPNPTVGITFVKDSNSIDSSIVSTNLSAVYGIPKDLSLAITHDMMRATFLSENKIDLKSNLSDIDSIISSKSPLSDGMLLNGSKIIKDTKYGNYTTMKLQDLAVEFSQDSDNYYAKMQKKIIEHYSQYNVVLDLNNINDGNDILMEKMVPILYEGTSMTRDSAAENVVNIDTQINKFKTLLNKEVYAKEEDEKEQIFGTKTEPIGFPTTSIQTFKMNHGMSDSNKIGVNENVRTNSIFSKNGAFILGWTNQGEGQLAVYAPTDIAMKEVYDGLTVFNNSYENFIKFNGKVWTTYYNYIKDRESARQENISGSLLTQNNEYLQKKADELGVVVERQFNTLCEVNEEFYKAEYKEEFEDLQENGAFRWFTVGYDINSTAVKALTRNDGEAIDIDTYLKENEVNTSCCT